MATLLSSPSRKRAYTESELANININGNWVQTASSGNIGSSSPVLKATDFGFDRWICVQVIRAGHADSIATSNGSVGVGTTDGDQGALQLRVDDKLWGSFQSVILLTSGMYLFALGEKDEQ